MLFNGSLASLGTGITYLLQVVCCYLATRSICALIQSARVRVRLWGGFLFLTITAWMSLWIPTRASGFVHYSYSLRPLPSLFPASLHIALPVADVLASYVARLVPAAAYLYISLLLISVVHLIFQSARLKAVLRQTQPPSHRLHLRFRRLCLQLSITRCELDLSPEVNSPATCYSWRSHVLLPVELVPRLDEDQLDDVLRHELLHVKRKDYLWDRLAALGCRLVFFHPLVWLGYRHLRWERELACDHAVVPECTEARLRYAECLTTLARWLTERKGLSPGISFFSSESLLAVRVRTLLREPHRSSTPGVIARTGLAAIVATISMVLMPGVGLSLYSPIHLTSLLTEGSARSGHAHKKAIGANHAFGSRAGSRGTPTMVLQASIPTLPQILSDSLPKALPVLSSSTTASVETDSAYVKGDIRQRGSRNIWDESPAPLATAPKWRTLAIRAITGGVGMVAGGIGVDDDDGPRKRGR
jgi:beta-lactamase regulating signal transducer with metallopeptidase domain